MAKKKYENPEDYWAERQQEVHDKLTEKNYLEMQRQMDKYYQKAAEGVIREFEATYNHILARRAEGQETPADLYKLDAYWNMLADLESKCTYMGQQVIKAMREGFEKQYVDIYESVAIPSQEAYSKASKWGAESMVNHVWLEDGKTFEDRVMGHTAYLMETLEEEFTHCVITGKSTSEMKMKLMERFNMSFRAADTLVRTELCHIQTEAANKRYKDAGITHYKFLGRDEHDIGCQCKKLNGEIFNYKEAKVGKNMPPMHPNCRCAVRAVLPDEIKEVCVRCKQPYTFKGEYLMCDDCAKEILTSKEGVYCLKKGETKKSVVNTYVDFDKHYEVINLFDEWLKQNHDFSNYRDENNKYVRNKAKVPEVLKDLLAEWRLANSEVDAWELEEEISKYLVQCIDCGTIFDKKDKRSNTQARCPSCQAKYRRQVKREDAAKRRANKKAMKS